MKLLLDECVWRLRRDLTDFAVKPSGRWLDENRQWCVAQGGAEREFDAFVTIDKNLSFQQNLAGFAISVVVLKARSLRLADLRKLVPELIAALRDSKKGKVQIVE